MQPMKSLNKILYKSAFLYRFVNKKDILLFSLALGVGALTAFGVSFFLYLLAFVHNLIFNHIIKFSYDFLIYTKASNLGTYIIVLPALVSLVTIFILNKFGGLNHHGHGTEEVLYHIKHSNAVLPKEMVYVKPIVASLTIGAGGAAGPEGPCIQLGAALASMIGRNFSIYDKIALIACGAGAGMAAVFNAPVSGIVFALQIILKDYRFKNFFLISVSSLTSAFIMDKIWGNLIALPVDAYFSYSPRSYIYWLIFFILGLVVGGMSLLFRASLIHCERLFIKVFPNNYWRHFVGMFIVGITLYWFSHLLHAPYYYVEGIGYATVEGLLQHMHFPLAFLCSLLFLKMFLTSITLGSGGIGGIFAPLLFIGGTLGAIFAQIVDIYAPYENMSMITLVIAAMAGIISSYMHAIFFSIILIIEITQYSANFIEIAVVACVAQGLTKIVDYSHAFEKRIMTLNT